ncbi:hypothetical protein GpartN1_g7599.t1 [Galdieria partita]|uniref:Transcription initiation factor IIE subunit alpha N-terminal domain-containing protein n=1 Tax=Galdieria partita TaxID=83374 RepID=A0A9C7Q3G6_9RHOD|nr:hypothetical protein GpartN1_g7599.t1 [Galdieria partita]
MAQVPKQIEDLVRVVARAFYTDLYIVVLDALVREKYIRQDLLSKKLHVATKELRKLLLQLQEQKLVKCEVRVQRKPTKSNNNNENSTEYQRAVKATFWYIDYFHLIDVIKYRVDGMRQKVTEMMAEGHVYQSFQCQKCKEVYSSLDSARLFVPTEGVLRCDNVIVRNTLCKGLVEEVELEGKVATVKELQTRMENELRPILEMVAQAEQEKVPLHPLEGLDADQLGMIISDNPDEQPSWDTLREEFYSHRNNSHPNYTQSSFVEKKDEDHKEEQVKVEIVATEEGTSHQGGNELFKQGLKHVPSWFEEGKELESRKDTDGRGVVENDWIVELEDSHTRGGESLEQVPLDEYSLAYYRSLIGATNSQTTSKEEGSELLSSQEPEEDTLFEETVENSLLEEEGIHSCNILMENGQVMVQVQGQLIALKDVKETHLKQMTTDEYLAYYETLMQTQVTQS